MVVKSIDPPPDLNRPLCFDPFESKVNLEGATSVDSHSSASTVTVPLDKLPQISSDGIGGLSEHIAIINESLAFLTNPQFTLADQHLIGPTAFLIHGPEGTGKTMLLERLSECHWAETFRLDSSSSSKAPAKELAETFEKARETQPSIILMDDIDKYLGKAETLSLIHI